MAMIAHNNKISVSYWAADSLVNAINHWLEYRPQPNQDKLTIAELLAAKYLFSVSKRLARRSISTQAAKKLDFSFTFTVQEIFAILTCIPFPSDNMQLRKLLGDIQQKSLNYEYLLKNKEIFYGKEKATSRI